MMMSFPKGPKTGGASRTNGIILVRNVSPSLTSLLVASISLFQLVMLDYPKFGHFLDLGPGEFWKGTCNSIRNIINVSNFIKE